MPQPYPWAIKLVLAVIAIGCILLALLFMVYLIRRFFFRKRCPKCQKRSFVGAGRIFGKKSEGGDYYYSFCLLCETGLKRFDNGACELVEKE
jgi:hypothetical protein